MNNQPEYGSRALRMPTQGRRRLSSHYGGLTKPRGVSGDGNLILSII